MTEFVPPPPSLNLRLISWVLRASFQIGLWLDADDLVKDRLRDQIESTVKTVVKSIPTDSSPLMRSVLVEEGHRCLRLIAPLSLRTFVEAEYRRKIAWRLQ
jgi:hypothetical protein